MVERFKSLRSRYRSDRNWLISLTILALSSATLTFWKLAEVSRSEYYAAIAKSMSLSWSNFLFGAIDPAGNVTLDKIPGSYWVPALFARIFGFSTWAITAPNALAAVGTVVVVAVTARNLYGRTTGIAAGVIVATTPIVIAVSRSNQPQSFFLLTISLAGWQAAKALSTSSRKHLMYAGAFIALAFHTYMLVAWALWPALIIAWFFTDGSLGKKILDLLSAGLLSLALSFLWIAIVTLTPASKRPYIGGTLHNSALEMVFGYNGLGRFSSSQGGGLSLATDNPNYRSFTPPFGGNAGFGRFFNSAVAGQISWLLPTAVAAVIVLFLLKGRRPIVVFYALWIATYFTAFSLVSGIHQFYTSSLSIPIAVVVAAAISISARAAQHIYLYLLLNVSGFTAIYFAAMYSGYKSWAPYVQGALILCVVATLSLHLKKYVSYTIPVAVVIGLVFTPAVWAIDARNFTNSINPVAGSTDFMGGGGFRAGGPQGGPQVGFGEQDNSTLISYLKAHRGGARYLLVTFGAQTAASYITATGENVLPVGGFDGQDPTPTLAEFKKLVQSGEIKYVLVGGQGRPGGFGGAQSGSEIESWVSENCNQDSGAPAQNLYLCQKVTS